MWLMWAFERIVHSIFNAFYSQSITDPQNLAMTTLVQKKVFLVRSVSGAYKGLNAQENTTKKGTN